MRNQMQLSQDKAMRCLKQFLRYLICLLSMTFVGVNAETSCQDQSESVLEKQSQADISIAFCKTATVIESIEKSMVEAQKALSPRFGWNDAAPPEAFMKLLRLHENKQACIVIMRKLTSVAERANQGRVDFQSLNNKCDNREGR